MSPVIRTFSFVFISLSVQLVRSQIIQGKNVIPSEFYPNGKSSGQQLGNNMLNMNPDLVSAAQRLLTNSQRPIFQEVPAQPVKVEPLPIVPAYPFQDIAVNVNTPNWAIPNAQQPCGCAQQPCGCAQQPCGCAQQPCGCAQQPCGCAQQPCGCAQQPCGCGQQPCGCAQQPLGCAPQVLPIQETYSIETFVPGPQCTIPAVTTVLNQNIPVTPAISINQMPQTFSVPEVIYADKYIQSPEISQACVSPISVSPMPSCSCGQITPGTASFIPFGTVVNQAPEVSPCYSTVYNSPMIEIPTVTNITPISDYGFTTIEPIPVCSQQLPYNFQINIPPPEQPIIMISPTAPSAPEYTTLAPEYTTLAPEYTTLAPSSFIPQPPVIILERSKSSWKSLLPILLLALTDNGCGCQNGCNCCGGCNIPIPYPIPFPINNPIFVGKGNSGSGN